MQHHTMPSLRQLAAQLDLSPATVSRALRHDPRLSEATIRRIWEAAGRVGVAGAPRVPVPAGRRLVGVLVTPHFRGSTPGPVFRGIRTGLRRLACDLAVLPAPAPDALAAWLAGPWLRDRRLAGLIAVGGLAPGTVRALAPRVPLVVQGGDVPDAPCDAVQIDHARAVEALVERLARSGHRRLGLLAYAGADAPNRDRAAGFLQATSRLGIACSLLTEGRDGDADACAERLALLAAAGVTGWITVIGAFIPPIWAALARHRLTVPGQVSVCCPQPEGLAPDGRRLTSCPAPRQRLGEEAVALLADRWAGRPPGRRVLVRGSLAPGQSDGPAPAATVRSSHQDRA